MIHREYKRIVKGSDTAVLFIHGIMGTPYQFRELVPLVSESWSVHNLLLPGHGKDPESFSRSSMREWEKKTQKAFQKLAKTHDNIIIVGHSMGTFLSIELALSHPDKVKLLFLQAVPLTPMLRYRALKYAHAILYQNEAKDTPDEAVARVSYSIEPDKNPVKYMGWYKRFLELFAKAWNIRKKLRYITTPCIAVQSRKDELVSNQAEKILRKYKGITTYALKDSSHYIYSKEDKEKMLSYFEEAIKKVK